MNKSSRYIIIIILLSMPVLTACGQRDAYDRIDEFYRGTVKEGYRYDPPLRFIDDSDIALPENKEIIQIMLIRHGIPKIDRANWITFYEARNFVEAYDTVEVYEIENIPVDIEPGEIETVYSSTLKRASSTAVQIFGDEFDIVYDPIFREFKNEIVPIPWIRLPLGFWRFSSRIFWMLGLHSGEVPSLPNERIRAKRAADKLAAHALEDKHVVLVAHGFINRFIIRYLKKEGWHHSYDGGFEYTNVQVMSKIVDRSTTAEKE